MPDDDNISDKELDRIIREIVSIHRPNFLEHGDRAKSKAKDIKEIINRNVIGSENED